MTDKLIVLGWDWLDDRSGLHLMVDLVTDDSQIVVGRKYGSSTLEVRLRFDPPLSLPPRIEPISTSYEDVLTRGASGGIAVFSAAAERTKAAFAVLPELRHDGYSEFPFQLDLASLRVPDDAPSIRLHFGVYPAAGYLSDAFTARAEPMMVRAKHSTPTWQVAIFPPEVPEVAPPARAFDDDLYVFISYARPDAAIAERVESYLRAAGVRVFRDTSDIRKGTDWDMTIERALNETQRMVLLLSGSSMPRRKEVHREWFYFDQENKPIYPLYVEKCKLHSRMYAYNYIDVISLGLQKSLDLLLAELGETFEPPDGEAGPIDIDDVDATTGSLPAKMAELLDVIRDPKGSIVLSKDQVETIRKHRPANITEYYLTRIVDWSQERYQLDNRFVNLTLLIDRGEKADGARFAPEDLRFTDLREVLVNRKDDPALVLLGAPGSGKSTLLRRFQLDHSMETLRSEGNQVTFFVQLNAYRADAGLPREWLNAEWSKHYPQLDTLDDLLEDGRVLLLLDALNEMPHTSTAHYHERVAEWRIFIQEIVPRGNRAIFSCRSLDYSATLSSDALPVPQVVIQPMSEEQIRVFLRAYLPAQADHIWDEMKAEPKLKELFSTPYFLKLLTEQVDNSADSTSIPRGRAGLFTGFVREALAREVGRNHALFQPDGLLTDRDHRKLALRQWRTACELPERGLLIQSLSGLAYGMQEKGLDTEGAQVRIDYDAACGLVDGERNEDLLAAGVALNVLDEDVEQSEILFFHQLLQEFFAARRLAREPNPDLVRTEWHVARVSPTLEEQLAQLADSDPLPLLPQTGWEETTLLAGAMADDPNDFVRNLRDANLPLAARCAAAPDVTVDDALCDDIRQALVARTQHPEADLRARIAAGLALGEIGDPRFERGIGPEGDEYLLPRLIPIPGGEYPIGSDEYDFEQPIHTVELESFQIGQFPVTNAEYALFMKAGGYDDERWWETDAAKAWLRGEGSTEGQKASVRDQWKTLQSWSDDNVMKLVPQRFTSEQAESYIWLKKLSVQELEDQLNEWYPSGQIYRQPAFWDDAVYNNPLQPVVGVCWFEARAYLKWLSAQAGVVFDLPTEVQVEAAAGGKDGRRYPYGPEFDVTRSNTFESHIRRTTPAGLFDNKTPEEVYDLTGNVYTWTRSIYDQDRFKYPYRADDGRENLNDAESSRVLRGGSWYRLQDLARAAYRFRSLPYYRSLNFGFRVCCAVRPPSRAEQAQP